MAVINPIENGLHSLATALLAAQRILAGDSDRYLGKDLILRTHHAVETVLKAALIEMNPVFVYEEKQTCDSFFQSYAASRAGANTFMTERTIGLMKALERLKAFGELKRLQEKEYYDFRERLKELEGLRNQFQHLGAEMDHDRVISLVGSVIPRFMDVVDALCGSTARTYKFWVRNYSSEGPDFEGFRTNLERLFPEAETVIEDLRRGHDQVARTVVESLESKSFEDLSLSIDLRDIGGTFSEAPEIHLSGFIDVELAQSDVKLITAIRDTVRAPSHLLERHRNNATVQGIDRYAGHVTFSRPEWHGPHDFSVDFELTLQLRLRTARPYIKFGPSDEIVDLLRWVDIAIDLRVSCRSAGRAGVHFSLQNRLGGGAGNVSALSGSLAVAINLLPLGTVERKGFSLQGHYSCALSEQNAFFDISGWLSPDGLVERPHVRWNSDTIADLIFGGAT